MTSVGVGSGTRDGASAIGARERRLSTEWLGRVAYGDALEVQERAVRDRLAGRTGDRLLLLEHPPVVTLGRSTDRRHLLATPEALAAQGVETFEVPRGGDVTYHAPGQLVGYPIVDLAALGRRDVHAHLRSIEAGLIDALEEVGVPARRIEGWTGVFVDRARSPQPDGPERKIASIGVGVRRWVTFHGFALNGTIDLRGFETIVPCGLETVRMTSVAAEFDAARGAPERRPADAALETRVRKAVSRAMSAHLGPSASPPVAPADGR